MLDVKNPNIDVDELMEKIRAEVANRKADPGSVSNNATNNNLFSGKWVQVDSALSSAKQVCQVGLRLPGMYKFKGWKRKIAVLVGRIYLRVSQLITRDQRVFNESVLDAIHALKETTKDLEHVAIDSQQGVNRIKSLEEKIQEESSRNNSRLEHIDQFLSELGMRVNAVESQIKGDLQSIKVENQKRWKELSHRMDELEYQIFNEYRELRDKVENSLSKFDLKLERNFMEITKEKSNYQQQINDVKQKVGSMKVNSLIQELRFKLPQEEVEQVTRKKLHNQIKEYDTLYFEFENHFRGTREEIKERQKVYLPFIYEVDAGTVERPVLDLGSGRGEWLELLKEAGLSSKGIDNNETMVDLCRDLGLEVYKQDVLSYLRGVPDKSVGAVTGFHIVEHLVLEEVIELMDETMRILQPNGIAIFETPNSQNILVGASNFYIDPTHKNPLHPATLTFLAKARGLSNVQTIPMHEYAPEYRFKKLEEDGQACINIINENIDRMNDFFFCAQDYALVGYKV